MNSLVRYEIRVTDIFVVCYKDIFERSKINKNMQNHSIVISKQKDNDEVVVVVVAVVAAAAVLVAAFEFSFAFVSMQMFLKLRFE